MPLGEFSIICFEFWGDFWRKSQKGAKEKLGKKNKIGPLRHSEGCLAAARLRAKKATPLVRYSVVVLHRNEVTVHKGQNFYFVSESPVFVHR